MKRNTQEFKELIYDLMNGSLDLERYPVKESQYVQNEFARGMPCERAYQKIYEANQRICEQFKVQEHEDVEIIINNFFIIAKCFAMKMYDYGVLFSTPSIK